MKLQPAFKGIKSLKKSLKANGIKKVVDSGKAPPS